MRLRPKSLHVVVPFYRSFGISSRSIDRRATDARYSPIARREFSLPAPVARARAGSSVTTPKKCAFAAGKSRQKKPLFASAHITHHPRRNTAMPQSSPSPRPSLPRPSVSAVFVLSNSPDTLLWNPVFIVCFAIVLTTLFGAVLGCAWSLRAPMPTGSRPTSRTSPVLAA